MATFSRRSAVALATTAIVLLAGVPAALADPDKVPSEQDVQAARDRVANTERAVSDIRADLAAAQQRLDDLAVQAAQAAEAYNGARWRLQQAREDARLARQKARQATMRLRQQGNDIGELVADSYQGGGGVDQLTSLLLSGDPEAITRRHVAIDGAASSLRARFDQLSASDSLAKVFRTEATAAVADARNAAQQARQARQAAADAVGAQQAAVGRIEGQRQQLLRELAEAQDISVELASERQAALEAAAELRRQRAAERAAEQARQREERPEQPEPPSDPPAEAPSDPPEEEPEPPPPPPAPPPPSGGVDAVIDFAYDQVGEPYVWGADGPDAWDCSGLTMRAWEQAGRYLSHYSVAQYYETSRVGYSDLQRGDLIFWASDSGDPDTIFHVALYIGDGQMIHAPRTGRPVEVQSVWYWESPDFYGRV